MPNPRLMARAIVAKTAGPGDNPRIAVAITRPIIAKLANSIRIENAAALATVRQRAFDAGADAGGFADALDVGGAL